MLPEKMLDPNKIKKASATRKTIFPREKKKWARKIPVELEKLKCFDEVLDLIKDGIPIRAIANFIQSEKLELVEIKLDSIKRMIYRYIKKLPPGELLETRIPPAYSHLCETINESIDGIKALENLFYLQFDRLMIDYRSEKSINKLFTTNTANVKLCCDIAAKIEEIKISTLGSSYCKKTEIETQSDLEKKNYGDMENRFVEKVRAQYGDKVAAVAADPAKRRKALLLHEKFKSICTPVVQEILAKYDERYGATAE